MKRFLASLSTISLIEVIGRHPAMAAGILMLLGVGGGAGIALLTTPAIVPFVSSSFNPNQTGGPTNNGLKPNAGTVGSSELPVSVTTGGPTGSFGAYLEMLIDPALGAGNDNLTQPFELLFLTQNGAPGQPVFFTQTRNSSGNGTQWWEMPFINGIGDLGSAAGSGYGSGLYPFQGTGGGCAVEPGGIWFGTNIQIVNPGFGCLTTPTFSAATVPNSGAAQAGITATCAASGVSGQMLVTTSVPVSPGLSFGQTYPLSGFTTTPTGVLNATFTATSVTGSGPFTVVGTASGTCPTAISSTGTFAAGVSGAFNFPALSTSSPYTNGQLGITTKNGQHICSFMGEYGDDSPTPGFQFAEMSDEKGNALPGSPALVTIPNMATANFTGATNTTAQSSSSQALNVSAMIPYTITSAAWSNAVNGFSGLGLVTFQVSSNPGFIQGSEFTASGMSPSSVNGTYIALAGTTTSAIIGNQLTGPGGVPQVLANPGTITTATLPQMVSVIFPGMQILGATPAAFVLPFGTFNGTGTGGVGTYALSANQTAALSGTIFAWQAYYYSAATGGSGPGGSTLTVRTQATLADFFGDLIGTSFSSLTGNSGISKWGGSLGNIAMAYGVLPTQAGGAPSTSDLASICTKQTDIQTYAKAKSLKMESLYRLNDLGIWGDSSNATITGFISGATATSGGTATLNVVSTPYGSLALASGTETAKLTGVGLPVAGASASTVVAATIPLTTTANSTYTVTFPSGVTSFNLGSSGSPVTFAVGAFAPALPIQSQTAKGWIDTTASVSTLHVASLDDGTAHSGFAGPFTGTLGTTFTGSIVPGTGSNGAAIGQGLLTVTSPSTASVPPQNAVVGVGTQLCPAVGTATFTCTNVLSLGTGVGYGGTYVVDVSQTVASTAMFGSGQIPGPATALQVQSVTAGALAQGMTVTDGGVSLAGMPLQITGGSGSLWTVVGNYYPPINADATMIGSLTTLVPGDYLQNAAITNPIKVVAYSGACGITGAYNGGPGCYTLSASPNVGNAVGSSSATVIFTGTMITDGAAIAPGPALTIHDAGASVAFPVTDFSHMTGSIVLSGTYDEPTLGGTPSGIQVLVSNSANGAPIAGCTPCNFGTLTGTISGGAWSGTIGPIPGGGPYFISVSATNGTAYATLPSPVKVGLLFAIYGQGQAAGLGGAGGGPNVSYFDGLWGLYSFASPYGGNEIYYQGPPIAVPGISPANFVPGQLIANAGNRYGVTGAGTPLTEAYAAFDQGLLNAFGAPAGLVNETRDGVGVGVMALGNVLQTQTVGAGDGSTLNWCSASKFCPTTGVSPGGPLFFDAASLTGAWFTGATITNPGGVPTLTFGSASRIGGALEPGDVLNTPNTPSLVRCLTGCSSQMIFNSSTWLLSNALDVGVTPTRADPPPALIPFGGTTTPWPDMNIQQTGPGVYGFGGFGTPIVKTGTFKVSVNGAVVCQDSATFAYNQAGGNCTGSGVTGFVNYQTGDYQITFATAPVSGAAIIATWTNIVPPNSLSSNSTCCLQDLDFMGDGTPQSGALLSLYSKTPGGINGHIFSGIGTDKTYFLNSASGEANQGYQFGGIGYSQMLSWLYSTKFAAVIPGSSPGVSFLTTGQWRIEGPLGFSEPSVFLDGITEQDAQDMATKSTFSSTVSIAANATVGTLTLGGPATGPMWEGEILGCVTFNATTCPVGPLSGVYITSLVSGAWGASGSVYNLASAAGPAVAMGAAEPMQNAVYYSGSGQALYIGTLNDLPVQTSGLVTTITRSPHPTVGFASGRRATSRWAAMIWESSAANTTSSTTDTVNHAADPKVDRTKTDAAGCDAAALAAPCFDVGTTYQASVSATWTGNTVTVSGGLAAHARPFVVGQAVICASCNSNLVITSLSVPPTESTASGAGEVGQTFTFTVNNASGQVIGGSGSGTITAGCSGTSGAGSNCIDIAISTNVGGTFGTAAAIDNCGANNLNGNAPNYVTPNGKCQGNGIGELVRAFHIGTQQVMTGNGINGPAAGSVYDDGVDLANGAFTQSSAFTCNIVATKVAQCVKGPLYTAGVFTSVGEWQSGSTYISYGDEVMVSGRNASLLGYVGGQSFPFTGGSGYANGTTTVSATCATIQSGGGFAPKFDITVAVGSIVNVVPSASTATPAAPPAGLGIGSTCTVPLPSGGSGGAIPTIPLAPVEGGGGIGTYNTDSNTMGMFLYDNSGEPGNPLNPFFTNGQGGYFEPGLPVRPFGLFQGAVVSG